MSIPMPDFCSPARGVRQTLDAALPALLRLGVAMDQLVLQSAGAGWVRGAIVGQSPAAGTPVEPSTRIVLQVAGTGSLETLPFPLRDSNEGEFRSDRLFALFDNPLLKLGYHLRAAGEMLDLHPDDPAGAYRWIVEIFGVKAEQWARERWYDVARLLPSLHRIAGRPNGPALALKAVFRLPASDERLVAGIAPVPNDRRTRLGSLNGRLGVDSIVGDGVTAGTSVEIDIGPVDLVTYRRHLGAVMAREREALYRLVLPAHLRPGVKERWHVGERSEGAVIGDPVRVAVLGVNAYLGRAA